MQSGELFLKIFKNIVLRDLIFKHIKLENKSLYYLRYSFYDYPLELLFKNQNQNQNQNNNNNNNNQLQNNSSSGSNQNNNNYNNDIGYSKKEFIKLKLNLYERYIYNNQFKVQKDFNISTIIKYQIDFNIEWFRLFLRWEYLDIELYERVIKLFKNEIYGHFGGYGLDYDRVKSHEILLSNNIPVINYSLERKYWFIDIKIINKLFKSTLDGKDLLQLFKYLYNEKKEILNQLIQSDDFIISISNKDMQNDYYLMEYYNYIKSIRNGKVIPGNIKGIYFNYLFKYVNGNYQSLDQVQRDINNHTVHRSITSERFGLYEIKDMVENEMVLNKFITLTKLTYQHFQVLCKLSQQSSNGIYDKIIQRCTQNINFALMEHQIEYKLLELSIRYNNQILLNKVLSLLTHHNFNNFALFYMPAERSLRAEYLKVLSKFRGFKLLLSSRKPDYSYISSHYFKLLPYIDFKRLNSSSNSTISKIYEHLANTIHILGFKIIKRTSSKFDSIEIGTIIHKCFLHNLYQTGFYLLSIYHLSNTALGKIISDNLVAQKIYSSSINFGWALFKQLYQSNFNNIINNINHNYDKYTNIIDLFKDQSNNNQLNNINNNNSSSNNNNNHSNHNNNSINNDNLINRYKQLTSTFKVFAFTYFYGHQYCINSEYIFEFDPLLLRYISNYKFSFITSGIINRLEEVIFNNNNNNNNQIIDLNNNNNNNNTLQFNIDLNGKII